MTISLMCGQGKCEMAKTVDTVDIAQSYGSSIALCAVYIIV